MVEPAVEQRAIAQLADQAADSRFASCDRAVDALMRQQHAAFQLETSANRPQRLPELAEVRQGCKLVASGDGEGHAGGLSGGWGRGNPIVVPANAGTHMWTAPCWQEAESNSDRSDCGHMSGLLMRSHMTAAKMGST